MGKDRQERKLRESRRVESDRDQSLQYPGATGLDTPRTGSKTKPALLIQKICFYIVRNRLLHISLMICIYIEITFRILYPPITFYLHLFPLKLSSLQ